MPALEHNVFLAFLVQALITAAVFALAICWFSCLRRYFRIAHNRDVSRESLHEAEVKPGDDDLPPNYSQVDLYSQMEVRASDVLFPPPSYRELSLPSITEESETTSIAGVTVESAAAIASRRRNSAPESLTVSARPADVAPAVHRNSISVLPMPNAESGGARDRANSTASETSLTSSLLTSKWLQPLLSFGRPLRQSQQERSTRKRVQRDHPYVNPASGDDVVLPSSNIGSIEEGIYPPSYRFAYDNPGIEVVDVDACSVAVTVSAATPPVEAVERSSIFTIGMEDDGDSLRSHDKAALASAPPARRHSVAVVTVATVHPRVETDPDLQAQESR